MDIQLPQILFQIINFSVVAGALGYFLYKPIQKILDERANRIEEAQLAAQKSLAESAKLDELKKSTKQQAEKEVNKMLEAASQAAKEKKAQLLAQAKEEALKEVERLRQAWVEEKRQAMASMKREFAEAVIATSQKVVGQSFDAKAHTKLIDQEMEAILKQI